MRSSGLLLFGMRAPLSSLCVLFIAGNLWAAVVESIDVSGTRRDLSLETKAGHELDERTISRDVRRLWDSGRFDDIRVESSGGDRLHLVFHVIERQRYLLRDVRFEPHNERRELTVEKGTPLTAASARDAALSLEKQLAVEGYTEARVQARLVPAGAGEADLEVKVDRGPKVRVGAVRLEGELGLDERRLREELRATSSRRRIPPIPGIWKGWIQRAPYTADRVESDLAALRSLYLSEGYLTATVGLRETLIDESRASIRIHADAGPRYQIDSARVETDNHEVVGEFSPGLPARQLCKCLFAERRKAEKQGRIDFSTKFEWERVQRASASSAALMRSPLAKVVLRFDPGPQYRIGRIEFRGHTRLHDSVLRRALVLDEGDLFDPRAMRVSLSRLNRISMLEPTSESDVEAHPAGNDVYDLTITLREQRHGRWTISGPLGPMSLFGPLRFSIDSRLPAWGRGVFDLSTWLLTAGLYSYADPVLSIVAGSPKNFWQPFVALHRPILPGQEWTSGFLLSPSVGLRQSAMYAALTHAQSRASVLLAGEGDASMPLSATVWNRSGEDTLPTPGMFVCRPEKSRLDWVRAGANLILSVASGVL